MIELRDLNFNALHMPIYQTVGFRQPGTTQTSDRGFELKYSREENPTVRELELMLAELEKGKDALAFNSGMASISALYLSLLRAGDEIVLSMEGYGTTIQLAQELKKFGIRVKLAYPDADSIVGAITEDTKLVFLETMTNPTLKVIDIPEVISRAKETDTLVAVDNTFTTPLLYNPLEDKTDFVIHSLTKYIAGHNDVLSGSIIWKKSEFSEMLWHWRRRLGGIIQPFEAWLVKRGLKTLEVRFKKQSKSALAIAEFLCEHPKVEHVMYPGLKSDPYHSMAIKLFKRKLFGGVVSFEIKEDSKKFLSSLRLIFPSPSLGGTESLASSPVISAAKTMSEEHRRILGITPHLIRLSVGLEDVNKLIEDLDRALGGD
ncbi:cystathionine gamma-synthase family protein [Thermococcus sp.]